MLRNRRTRTVLQVELLESRLAPSATPGNPIGVLLKETFDTTAAGAMPGGWAQWSNQGAFSVLAPQAGTTNLTLSTTGTSTQVARAWVNSSMPGNVYVSSLIYLNSLVPGQVIARGSSLSSSTPTYYAIAVSRGMQVELLRVVNGSPVSLSTLSSTTYVSNLWVRAAIFVNGSNIQAQVVRPDTGQYLNGQGNWQASPAYCLTVQDSATLTGGLTGVGRGASYQGTVWFDDFTVYDPFNPVVTITAPAPGATLTTATTIAASATDNDQIDHVDLFVDANLLGTDSVAPYSWVVDPSSLADGSHTLSAVAYDRAGNSSSATLNLTTQKSAPLPDTQAPQVSFASPAAGSTLTSKTTVQINATDNVGVTLLLVYLDNVRVGSLTNAPYSWDIDPATLVDGTHTLSVLAYDQAGNRGSASLSVTTKKAVVSADTVAPQVSIISPTAGNTLTTKTAVQVNATDNVGVTTVLFYLDNTRIASFAAGPFSWVLDPSTIADGSHSLTALAYDKAGNRGQATVYFSTSQGSSVTMPNVPRHYSHIRIAQLAYSGTPLGAIETQLLKNSVDLVIPNTDYLNNIAAVAPNTPQLIYTNTSSIYLELLTSWLNYADAHGVNREDGFLHVAQATPFSGGSASSQVVSWFWGVYLGGTTANYTDMTSAAHSSAAAVDFDAVGTSMYLGFPDKFREINVNLASAAANGWSAALEYATAVNVDGDPTAWAALPTLTNTTAGLKQSGQITFDPPANWKASAIGSSDKLFYVRFRTVTNGTAPVANTLLGRDWVGSNGGTSGVIPAFDYAADTNHDGYLNNTEYSHRASGLNARFVYESRVFHSTYGQMRPATNPSSAAFRNWAVQYQVSFLAANPLADGLFMDNSGGKAPVDGFNVIEPLDTYSTDYGAMLGAISRAIAPKWILANTSAGGTEADSVVRQSAAYFEEFALRPLMNNWQQFEDLAAKLDHRAQLRSPAPFVVLDALPTGGSPTDPRTQLATLAYYYLLADPKTTFIDFFGGSEPASTWSRHWVPAAAYNIGQPAGQWSLFATGADPANRALKYNVYQRTFSNALVLYKPLSYIQGATSTGTIASTTATTHSLGGTYRALNADGTLGAVVTSVTLKNGEGAVLIRV